MINVYCLGKNILPIISCTLFKNLSIKPTLSSLGLPVKKCLCSQIYICYLNIPKYDERVTKRKYSVQSDHHRQKVILETAPSKTIVDKLNQLKTDFPNVEHQQVPEKLFWQKKILPYIRLARWDRPIGVYLLYWPCTWSIALGSIPGTVPLLITLQTAGLFLVGAGLMRGAGCTINDLWDRDIDSQVDRTKNRPLVSGALSEKQAIIFLASQLSLALGVLLQLNCYSIVLGASSMFLVITYPLAKRYTNYPQIFLGATFNWGALLGYSAMLGTVNPAICLPLYLGALSWTVIYDTIYAHQDKLDDARIGIKSTALTFGSHTKPALCGTLAVCMSSLAVAGYSAQLQWPYAAALTVAGSHAAWQIYTLNPDSATDCANKFKSNSFIGFVILLGILGGGYKQYTENRQKNEGKDNIDKTKRCLF